jgi:PPOX class probable F420-dependent enzyme
MPEDKLAPFVNQKYINLQTFRKSGEPVNTPIWFAGFDGEFCVYTTENTWKVKRMRNNPRVRIAPCDARGNLKGEWVDGEARFLEGAEAERAQVLLTRKYGLLKRLMDFFSGFRKYKRVAFAIKVT